MHLLLFFRSVWSEMCPTGWSSGGLFTLWRAMESLLPELFGPSPSPKESKLKDGAGGEDGDSETAGGAQDAGAEEPPEAAPQETHLARRARIKLIRVQGIVPGWDTPFAWIVNNLSNPDFFLHVCILVSASQGSQAWMIYYTRFLFPRKL